VTLQDNQKTFQSLIQTQVRSPQVKIIPFDPKEILRAQNELRQQQLAQSRLLGDNQQLFLIRTNETDRQQTGSDQRDILQEATEHILQDQQQHQHQQQQTVNFSDLVMSNNVGIDRTTSAQQHPPTELIISSPGFVRVTPNCITVKSPLAKKPQRVKKRL
jgi:hypothetical protein